MITLLQSEGYHLVNVNTDSLTDNQFRQGNSIYNENEEYSTFDEMQYDVQEEFDLSISKNLYSGNKIDAILNKARQYNIDDISIAVDVDYWSNSTNNSTNNLIRITTIKKGVK